MIQIYVLIFLLIVSLFMNIYMFLRFKNRKSKGNSEQTIELQDFLSDLLTQGVGMVSVSRVDPSNIFYHNVKGR